MTKKVKTKTDSTKPKIYKSRQWIGDNGSFTYNLVGASVYKFKTTEGSTVNAPEVNFTLFDGDRAASFYFTAAEGVKVIDQLIKELVTLSGNLDKELARYKELQA